MHASYMCAPLTVLHREQQRVRGGCLCLSLQRLTLQTAGK